MCGESRMHGVKRGKTRRLYQRVTYRYSSHRSPTKRFLTQGVNSFMRISELLTQQDLQTLISSLEDFRASRSVVPERDLDQRTSEAICSLSLPESLKPSDLAILSLRMYPDCWVLKKGRLSKSSLKRFQSWGIAWNGLCMTAPASASRSRENECTLQDVLESIVPEKYWLSETATRKIAGK